MQYELKHLKYAAAPVASEDNTTFSQAVTIKVGIVGDDLCFNATTITINDVHLSLGEGIPAYIKQKCEDYVIENYPQQ